MIGIDTLVATIVAIISLIAHERVVHLQRQFLEQTRRHIGSEPTPQPAMQIENASNTHESAAQRRHAIQGGTELMKEAIVTISSETWDWLTAWSQLRVLLPCVMLLAIIITLFFKCGRRRGRPTNGVQCTSAMPKMQPFNNRANSALSQSSPRVKVASGERSKSLAQMNKFTTRVQREKESAQAYADAIEHILDKLFPTLDSSSREETLQDPYPIFFLF